MRKMGYGRKFLVIVGIVIFVCMGSGIVEAGNALQLTSDPATDWNAVWSPDGTRIAFVSQRSGSNNIWIMSADGTNQTQLTKLKNAYSPSWSPDGTKIAFESSGDIWTVNTDGTGLTQLTTSSSWEGAPSYSPDGTRIAFHLSAGGSLDIFVMNSDGTNRVQLTTHPAIDGAPAWSADGTKIAFHSTRSGNDNIWIVDAYGGEPIQLTTNDEGAGWNTMSPSWSPDGNRIAFNLSLGSSAVVFSELEKATPPPPPKIWIMNADGTGKIELIEGNGPSWSPDGSKVVFHSTRSGNSDIWVIDAP